MKTDDLITLLATGTPPVRPHAAARRTALALAAGLPLSVLLMLAVLGLNPQLSLYATLPMFWVKFGLPLLMVAAAAPLVTRLGRPGVGTRMAWAAWTVPVLVLWLLGFAVWLAAPEADRPALLMGRTWRGCAECIALLSLPVFVAALWALRGLAPTQPALAGAGAGALAGAAGAMVYALHCPELAAPFLAIWYVAGMAIPVVAGALLGPRLLRW